MPCAFCGEGDRWIKTCRTEDGLIRVCDPCYEVLSQWLVVVSGDAVVTSRCDECGAYFNPREMAKVSPGGRYNAYSGTCRTCAMVSDAVRVEVTNPVVQNLQFTLGTPGARVRRLSTGGTEGRK
jgi:hypothetical protein